MDSLPALNTGGQKVNTNSSGESLDKAIEIFYNRIRKQARLGYLSPAQFTQQYHAKQIAA